MSTLHLGEPGNLATVWPVPRTENELLARYHALVISWGPSHPPILPTYPPLPPQQNALSPSLFIILFCLLTNKFIVPL